MLEPELVDGPPQRTVDFADRLTNVIRPYMGTVMDRPLCNGSCEKRHRFKHLPHLDQTWTGGSNEEPLDESIAFDVIRIRKDTEAVSDESRQVSLD